MMEPVILLVEDDRDDEALAVRALRRANVANQIEVVRDGVEALDYLFCEGPYSARDIGNVPAVVLLDLKLPRVDGLEVLRRLRQDERTKLLPIVVFTSSDEERDRLESYQLGANSYVRKPVDFDQFADALRVLGVFWLVLNLRPPLPKPV